MISTYENAQESLPIPPEEEKPQVLDSDIQPCSSSTSEVSENVNLGCPNSEPLSPEAGHVSEISETAHPEKILPEVNTPQITPAKADDNDLTDLKEEDSVVRDIHNPALVDASLIKTGVDNYLISLYSFSHNQRWEFHSVDDKTKLEELTVYSYDTRLKEKRNARSIKDVNEEPDFIPEEDHNDKESVDAIEKYILPNIDSDTLTSRKFDVDQLKEISDDQVKTFLTDVHAILKNLGSDEGMDESMTDMLLNNLLVQIIGLHKHPLKVSIQPRCRLYIADEPYVTAHPEFVVTRKDVSMVVVEDKHLRNTCLTNPKGFGEAQLAFEILACGSENMRQTSRKTGLIPDQTIFGIRAISTYFTFYKTVISKEYWNELDFGLPQTESVVIERWPEGERSEDGLDIAEPNGRREVLDALARIRQFLLQ
ncbi:15730_t:CDS:2 [Funneliformis mosseae]|uniref:15730_t:CDS:1 n=1 Tax=Funneliformis mosseae TaxID=27381 RepID=A0A9N9CSF4_FUNMO|nr:15730_t:CDS:2 [Funneliformis mosseae]